MREAIRSSGELGRKRVEDNELRRQRKDEMSATAPAEGEKDDEIGRMHRFVDLEGDTKIRRR